MNSHITEIEGERGETYSKNIMAHSEAIVIKTVSQ